MLFCSCNVICFVVEGVKGMYALLNIVTPVLPLSFVVVEWKVSLL